MFELNRYAKLSTCKKSNRDEIYNLKGRLIRRLCENGLIERIAIHSVNQAAQRCFRCNGTGILSYQESCERCFGSGDYRLARDLEFVVFSFEIEQQRYTWHQPRELVTWDLPAETPYESTDWETGRSDFDVTSKSTFRTESKDLIRYYLGDTPDEYVQ